MQSIGQKLTGKKKTDRVSIFLRKQTKLIGDKVTIGSRLRCFIS